MLDIDRSVCGCDYGGSSWTTLDVAELISSCLELGPSVSLSDLGHVCLSLNRRQPAPPPGHPMPLYAMDGRVGVRAVLTKIDTP